MTESPQTLLMPTVPVPSTYQVRQLISHLTRELSVARKLLDLAKLSEQNRLLANAILTPTTQAFTYDGR